MTVLRKGATNALLVFLSLGAAFLLGEVALRAAGISYPDFMMVDDDLGWAHRPGSHGWWREEGESYVRINRDGLRDRPHTVQKPSNTFRIAVLGDSYAEAFQVPMKEAFWSVAERGLGRCPAFQGLQIEAINFGVSGYGTAQELLVLRNKVWKYSPDVVLLAFTSGNDVRNNSRALEPGGEGPFFTGSAGALVADTSFRTGAWFQAQRSPRRRVTQFIYDHSRIRQLVARAQLVRRTRRNASAAIWRDSVAGKTTVEDAAEAPAGAEPGMDDRIYLEPGDATWRDAWKITEVLLGTIHEEVRRRGARFMVVTLSNAIQVHPGAEVRSDYMRRFGIADLFYPDRRIARTGKEKGFTVLALAPTFQRHAQKQRVFLHGFDGSGQGHWNQRGHALAGGLIASELCRQGRAAPTTPPAD